MLRKKSKWKDRKFKGIAEQSNGKNDWQNNILSQIMPALKPQLVDIPYVSTNNPQNSTTSTINMTMVAPVASMMMKPKMGN